MRVRALVSGLAIAMLGGSLAAQPAPFLVSLEDRVVAVGGTTSTPLLLDHEGPDIIGWSVNVCHDPDLLEVTAVETGSTTLTVQGGLPPDFEQLSLFATGWHTGVVISFEGSSLLGPGAGYELAVATYDAVGPLPAVASLEVCTDVFGPPPFITAILLPPGDVGVFPAIDNGVIEIVMESEFRRGDLDGNGAVQIIDVFGLLDVLHGTAPVPPCPDAADGNDDGDLTIGDAIAILEYLFTPGSPTPPPPGPTTCGSDPTDDGLSCLSPAC